MNYLVMKTQTGGGCCDSGDGAAAATRRTKAPAARETLLERNVRHVTQRAGQREAHPLCPVGN